MEWSKKNEEFEIRRGRRDTWFSTMMQRLNLQCIGSYIRDGGEIKVLYYDNLKERIDKAYEKIETQLSEKHSKKEKEEIMTYVNAYSGAIEDVYFSMGMKAGAILQNKLIGNFETDI